MKNFLILLISTFLYHSGVAQNFRFRVTDIVNRKPVEGAQIVSSQKLFKPVLSDAQGYFNVHVHHHDTITIHKASYHDLSLGVSQNNFDTTHYIALTLVPSINADSAKKIYPDLQSFEYHFVHDNIKEDSHVKVHLLENAEAAKARQKYTDKAVHFGSVNVHHNTNPQGRYRLKK